MGKDLSKPKEKRPAEANNIPGVIPIDYIDNNINYEIENLVFGSGGSLSFSYAGALRVLEKLGVLENIKRFAGVGTGSIVAALCAVNYDSNEIQDILDQCIDDLISDDLKGYSNVEENLITKYGWNSGIQFMESFDKLIASKLGAPEITLRQLYDQTSKELCIVGTNVNRWTIDYLHPKTTPNLTIAQAVFMSLSIPGVFGPEPYGLEGNKYLILNGSLLCSYPIHCFDGWLLSMDPKDSLINHLQDPKYFNSPEDLSLPNKRTLGFYPIERHRETLYKGLTDRITNITAGIHTPDTFIGRKYEHALRQKRSAFEYYGFLRKTCCVLIDLVNGITREDGTISEEQLADNIFAGSPLAEEARLLAFPEFGNDPEECGIILKNLFREGKYLTQNAMKRFVEKKLLMAVEDYSRHCKDNVENLHTYFGTVFEAKRNFSLNLSETDIERTIGIMGGYVGSRNVNFERDDQTYLYLQGWNATVAYFHELKKKLRSGPSH